MAKIDPYKARTALAGAAPNTVYYRLDALKEAGLGDIDALPYSIKVLLESVLRNLDGDVYTEAHIQKLAGYNAKNVEKKEFPFMPGRVILQDFTGVPAVVDFAALRAAVARMGGDVSKVNPLVRADLVIDHSVQVDYFGTADAMLGNTKREFERNQERYEFLKWGQQAFDNFSVVPPETGIVHQVNLEYLAPVVMTQQDGAETVAYADSVFGTDSHTTMVNGLGVLGWGVGGIEAEAAMLGQPSYLLVPEVIGFELKGKLAEGATATDLVLTVTEMLRKHGVVEKFVEFFGSGLDELSLADRATIGNMAPEYGATCGFFPVDQKTLDYLNLTGRPAEHIALVETYAKANGFWRDDNRKIVYTATLALDLSTVEPSVAGPARPQDRILLSKLKGAWQGHRENTYKHAEKKHVPGVTFAGKTFDLTDGDVVIAAITSCTNTSNPYVMVGAGLLAQKANEKGLHVKPWVKTSLAPGSRVVTDYLDRSHLSTELEKLGFFTVGYGCTTCIGNSGPVPEPIADAIAKEELAVASVLSGNRNFEGRISPQTRANFLMSPPMVVAFAIAGTVDWDPYKEPIGTGADGKPVMLADIWPSNDEIAKTVGQCVITDQFRKEYADVYKGPEAWQALEAPTGATYTFSEASTYIQEPPFFVDMPADAHPIEPIVGARVLAVLGDSTTTDHISPAGSIAKDSPAGKFLAGRGIERRDWNSYGSRRGNDRIMTRGTFANIRIKNKLAPGTEGGVTTYLGPAADQAAPAGFIYTSEVSPKPGDVVSIYDASVKYQTHRIPLIVLAGNDYGMGSSRDWAAKGTFLLGVRAVIAESYERIHRSNLIGMGVLPLQFKPGETPTTLGLSGRETFTIAIDDDVAPLSDVKVTAVAEDGKATTFAVLVRIDTPIEKEYVRNGGVLHTVLRRIVKS